MDTILYTRDIVDSYYTFKINFQPSKYGAEVHGKKHIHMKGDSSFVCVYVCVCVCLCVCVCMYVGP